jgi:GTP-binding protein
VDTGGIGLLRREKAGDVIIKAAMEQVDLAVESANVIILVVNVQEGIVPLDREVAQKLRRSGKPILVAINKVDTHRAEISADEFSQLGFDKIFPVSAIHGEGIEPLMDTAMALLPVHSPQSTVHDRADEMTVDSGLGTRDSVLKLAIVGRPNVGKSSIINALTQSGRVIVSPVPGTTRDAIDVPFEVETDGVRQQYVLIDTAGMRKARRVDDSIEFFSVQRAVDSIERSDITVLVLDAEAGITEQDKKIED